MEHAFLKYIQRKLLPSQRAHIQLQNDIHDNVYFSYFSARSMHVSHDCAWELTLRDTRFNSYYKLHGYCLEQGKEDNRSWAFHTLLPVDIRRDWVHECDIVSKRLSGLRNLGERVLRTRILEVSLMMV